MVLNVLAVTVVSAAVLYALYKWFIPAAVQNSGWLALIWHDVIVERFLNILTGLSRPQVTPAYPVSLTYAEIKLFWCKFFYDKDAKTALAKIPDFTNAMAANNSNMILEH